MTSTVTVIFYIVSAAAKNKEILINNKEILKYGMQKSLPSTNHCQRG